jgi:hypothetical protein
LPETANAVVKKRRSEVMATVKPQKARIVGVDDPSKVVNCQFNPAEFAITREIRWHQEPMQGNDAPSVTFAGGKSRDLTIPLLFDTTSTGKDVRDSYKALLEMAQINTKKKDPKTGKGEPPRCRFEWGNFLRNNAFVGVITQVTQKFTMFKSDGTPVRAELEVTFSETAEKPKGQNPTSQSETRKIWVVEEGQTLDWIAYQEYGDPAHWRHIAETNNLDDPKDLHPGQVLKLVPLS